MAKRKSSDALGDLGDSQGPSPTVACMGAVARASDEPIPATDLHDFSNPSGTGNFQFTPCNPNDPEGASLPQLVRCEQRRYGHLSYHPVLSYHAIDFLAFLDSSPPGDVVRLFRQVLCDLAARSICDFHLRIAGPASRGQGGGRGRGRGGGGGREGGRRGGRWNDSSSGYGRGRGGSPHAGGNFPPFRGGPPGGEFPPGGRGVPPAGGVPPGGSPAEAQRSFAVEVLYGEAHEGPVTVDMPHGCIACNPLAPLFPPQAPAAGATPGAGTGASGASGARGASAGAGARADPGGNPDRNLEADGAVGTAAAAAAAGGGGSDDSVMTSGDLILREYEADQPHVRVSLDAQGRAGLIITPLRHVESLSALSDPELLQFFRSAAAAVRRERVAFSRMVVNHGSYRNLPHLHLKVFLDEGSFEEARRGWGEERRGMWAKLLRLRPEKSAFVCKEFVRRGSCRFGERCRNLHSTGGGAD